MPDSTRIGFSTGVFYPHLPVVESFRTLVASGVTAIEIGPDYTDPMVLSTEVLVPADLAGCTYISHHAPAIGGYGKNQRTTDVFARIKALHEQVGLHTVVFHPDQVADFSVFHGAPFPVAFENMDWRNTAYRKAEEMSVLLEQDSAWQMVLDVNHVYTNDHTLTSLAPFLQLCGERVVEVHISGFATLHDPLYITKQTNIIAALKDIPSRAQVIVESQLEGGMLKAEWKYICSVLAESDASCSVSG